MELSFKQTLVYHEFRKGMNMFITGPGGTGKSTIIKILYGYATLAGVKAQVCAMTGCAALLLGCEATTVHRWAGIGIMNGKDDDIKIGRAHV